MTKILNHTLLSIILICSSMTPVLSKDLTNKELKEKIVNSWLENSARIDSYRFQYELEVTYHKGMANYFYRFRKEDGRQPKPDKELTTKLNFTIVKKPGYLKVASHGQQYYSGLEKSVLEALTRIIKPDRSFSFRYYSKKGVFPLASLDNSKDWPLQDFNRIIWFPIKMSTRFFSHDYYSDKLNCKPLELNFKNSSLANSKLLEATVPVIGTSCNQVFLKIDSKHNHFPVYAKLVHEHKEEISYLDKTEEWHLTRWKTIDDVMIPQEWTYNETIPDGRKIKTIKCKLIKSKINIEIPEKDFKMKLPVGTWFNDYINNIHYVIQTDGYHRMIPEDIPILEGTYDVLMNPKFNHLKTEAELNKQVKANE